MKKLIVIASLLISGSAFAASGGGWPVEHVGANVSDTASVQRGARLFVNYCLSCHSATYMRYNRLVEDLGIPEDVVLEEMVFDGGKIGDTMEVAMTDDMALELLGVKAPDLSVIARSRGSDWLYTYFKSFYVDATRPTGWNNALFPGVSMPHVFWEQQGIQKPIYETHVTADGRESRKLASLELVEEGAMSTEDYDAMVMDLVNYLTYMGDPSAEKRHTIGMWVLLYLALLTFLLFLVKKEFWSDVH